MSPSPTGDSPPSATNPSAPRQFPLSGREAFTVEVPSATLTAITNGAGMAGIKSPSDLKSQRNNTSFSRDGILGAAHKARTMSQQNAIDISANGSTGSASKSGDDIDNLNPLKRRNTDVGVDYPRRRATIAVRHSVLPGVTKLTALTVRSVPFEKVTV